MIGGNLKKGGIYDEETSIAILGCGSIHINGAGVR
jgi:hypothetical protein